MVFGLLLSATTAVAAPVGTPTEIFVQKQLVPQVQLPHGGMTKILGFRVTADPNGFNNVVFLKHNNNGIDVRFQGQNVLGTPVQCDLVNYTSQSTRVVWDTVKANLDWSPTRFDFSNGALGIAPGQTVTLYVECDLSTFTTDGNFIVADIYGLNGNKPINYTSGNYKNYQPTQTILVEGDAFYNP